jgi:hypothetical protein
MEDNLSSSPFLLVGSVVDIKDVDNRMVRNKNLVALCVSIYNDNGQDVFKIKDAEQLAFLKSQKDLNIEFEDFIIVDSFIFSENQEGEIDSKNLPKGGKVRYFTGIRDPLYSRNVEQLIEKYDSNNEIKNNMQKYLRYIKINKIDKK